MFGSSSKGSGSWVRSRYPVRLLRFGGVYLRDVDVVEVPPDFDGLVVVVVRAEEAEVFVVDRLERFELRHLVLRLAREDRLFFLSESHRTAMVWV